MSGSEVRCGGIGMVRLPTPMGDPQRRGPCNGCPDCSPEADEQVGGEAWPMWVRASDLLPMKDEYASDIQIEVVPASSSIPTEKVREVVEQMRDRVQNQTAYWLTADERAAYKACAVRLSALLEGTDDA